MPTSSRPAAVLAPMVVLFVLGLALVTLVAGLALAALGARQVRSAEALISHQPGETILFGLAGLVVIPVVAILAMITIIGAPLGLAVLFMVWPAAAFAGYLVAGIWIGEWLLYRGTSERPERPYLAAVARPGGPAGREHHPVRWGDRQPVRVRRGAAAGLACLPSAVRSLARSPPRRRPSRLGV